MAKNIPFLRVFIYADDVRAPMRHAPRGNAEKSAIWKAFEPETGFCRDDKRKVVLKRLYRKAFAYAFWGHYPISVYIVLSPASLRVVC